MALKIILFILAATVIGCFYLQSQQIRNLENKVESLESDIEEINEKVIQFDTLFIILINEIKKQRGYKMAHYYK